MWRVELRHEVAQEMRDGPSEPACRGGLQRRVGVRSCFLHSFFVEEFPVP
jgi:hypothetical protein